MYIVQYCPYCGQKELIFVGISGVGTIYRCSHCKNKFTIV